MIRLMHLEMTDPEKNVSSQERGRQIRPQCPDDLLLWTSLLRRHVNPDCCHLTSLASLPGPWPSGLGLGKWYLAQDQPTITSIVISWFVILAFVFALDKVSLGSTVAQASHEFTVSPSMASSKLLHWLLESWDYSLGPPYLTVLISFNPGWCQQTILLKSPVLQNFVSLAVLDII